MARGLKKIEVNSDQFQMMVTELEEKNFFSSRSELWKAVEATDWAKSEVSSCTAKECSLYRFRPYKG